MLQVYAITQNKLEESKLSIMMHYNDSIMDLHKLSYNNGL